jgi:XisH protein
MPARDHDHEHVRRALVALVNDGWTITHDPLRLRWGGRDMYVDLGAERILAAQKAERKIAVECKTFAGPSLVDDLEKAVGSTPSTTTSSRAPSPTASSGWPSASSSMSTSSAKPSAG